MDRTVRGGLSGGDRPKASPEDEEEPATRGAGGGGSLGRGAFFLLSQKGRKSQGGSLVCPPSGHWGEGVNDTSTSGSEMNSLGS